MPYMLVDNSIILRRSYMSAHVLLNLLNELEKVIKSHTCRSFYRILAPSCFKNRSIKVRFFYLMTLKLL